MDSETVRLLKNLLGSNGYVDEAVGSFHRMVDAHEKIANQLERIADSLEEGVHVDVNRAS